MNRSAEIEGFHVCQLTLPKNNPICATNSKELELYTKNWNKILVKQRSYSERRFLNEVVGVSAAQGGRFLSLEDLHSMCDPSLQMQRPPKQLDLHKYRLISAGIDWGGGGTKEVSRTTLSIKGLRHDGKFELIYHKIYPLENPVHSIEDIYLAVSEFQVKVIGADAGGGSMPNALLRERFGYRFVFPFAYLRQNAPLVWDDVLYNGCYKVDRTTVIDTYSLNLKKDREVIYPNVNQCGALFKDMLNVHEETTKHGRKIWTRHPKMPDDSLHSQIYAWMALKIMTGDRSFLDRAKV